MYPPTHTQISELDNYNKLSLWLSLKMQSVLYLYSLAPHEMIASIQNIKAIGDHSVKPVYPA